MESYTLFQLNEYIRRVIALNFREPIWIEAEIAQIKESRGNHYLELIEKEEDGDQVIAQMSGAIWYRNFQFIKKKLGDLIYDLLAEGTQVRIKCQIDFHERYGLKVIVQDLDPKFTFGQLEIKRQEIINRLEEEGLMELNKALLLPSVIQKIAVISTRKAAGYQDFVNQLQHNNYGYTFKIDLFDSAVQGVNVESDTVDAIANILSSDINYDVVCIIRGGGSKLDLAGYDNYAIASAIALSELPFLIGIGHDIDSTVTDLVACLSLKTPTAVADYLIDRNMQFEAGLESMLTGIHRGANNLLRQHQLQLGSLMERMELVVSHVLSEEDQLLMHLKEDLSRSVKHRLEQISLEHQRMTLTLDAKDPVRILMQGYSYLKKNDRLIKSVQQLEKDDEVTIQLADGHINSKIL